MEKLSGDLAQELAFLQQMFGQSADFYTKELQMGAVKAAFVLFTGISSPEKLSVMVLDLLKNEPALPESGAGLAGYLLRQSHIAAEPGPITSVAGDASLPTINSGMCVCP